MDYCKTCRYKGALDSKCCTCTSAQINGTYLGTPTHYEPKNNELITYKNLDKYICDKVYKVETKELGHYKGYLLNYNFGNLVLLIVKGVVHLQYKDISFMAPCKATDELQLIIDDINGR